MSSRDVYENEHIEKIAKSLIIIKSQRIKNALLTALADEEMVKIMNCVMNQSKSFNDITAENRDIPNTTAFRKTKSLLNNGFLVVDKVIITPAGKKFSFYHSTSKAINVKYENNNVIVEAEQDFDIPKKWVANFFSLDRALKSYSTNQTPAKRKYIIYSADSQNF